jgi:hypothetical protein
MMLFFVFLLWDDVWSMENTTAVVNSPIPDTNMTEKEKIRYLELLT